MRITRLLLIAACVGLTPANPARAASACVAAYEATAGDYWRIVGDMIQFKAMFDNYSTLCQKYYPEEIAALQPQADQLRVQVARDMEDAPRVMTKIFAETLPDKVAAPCDKDSKARTKVRKAFLSDMKDRAKTLTARMQKSGATLRDPQDSLKLCRDLRALKPLIEKKLGADLAAPLFSMSELNSRYMIKDSKQMQAAFDTYRATLQSLPPVSRQ